MGPNLSSSNTQQTWRTGSDGEVGVWKAQSAVTSWGYNTFKATSIL